MTPTRPYERRPMRYLTLTILDDRDDFVLAEFRTPFPPTWDEYTAMITNAEAAGYNRPGVTWHYDR